ncbi:dephospho-CoA kinase [Streptococcus criceti HS-6]|uniref:Dephospho-CoA kinase n=2 Tax=Streptococcus criceti TaxID=1333 RepID=G5JTC5_STRCG|nr:dephospho-CoA kinase [Streptococcus criceti HS-6]
MSQVSKEMSKIIGLTGGIASGKSTVTAYLRQKGYQVIDADQLVHDLQAKGKPLYQALILAFGTGILAPDQELDRPKFAQLIFNDPAARKKSADLQDRIIHQELAKRRDQLAKSEKIFFMDLPLLFELDYQDWFDEIWLVALDEDQQIERLMARNGYSLEEAEKRIAAQLPLSKKIRLADRVIDNNGSLEETYAQLEQQLERLSAN